VKFPPYEKVIPADLKWKITVDRKTIEKTLKIVAGGKSLGLNAVRRADGRTMGQAMRQDFADPYGLDLWIGLPEAEHGRVAQLRKPSAPPDLGEIDAIKRAAFLDRGSAPGGRGSTLSDSSLSKMR
jgi:hypothetical protein